MTIKDIRDKFEELLGTDVLNYITSKNWVQFDEKLFVVYNRNEIEINFMEMDWHEDVVNHQSICYNLDTKKWISENCIDIEELEFDSFPELKAHVDSIEDEITGNSFKNIDLPNFN